MRNRRRRHAVIALREMFVPSPTAKPTSGTRIRNPAIPRAKVVSPKRLTRAALAVEAITADERATLADLRPRTRAECVDGLRPCPWVGCRHHLYLDVNPETGSIKFNYPDLEPDELAETCALDIAAGGGITLEEVGGIMNITRERVRQIELRGLIVLREGALRLG